MKIRSVSLSLVIVLFSVFVFSACAEKKSEKKPEVQEVKEHDHKSEMVYQCPMDCEEGKTYDKEGSCPVCKMDLKAKEGKHVMTCKKHKDGKCSCEGEKCKCENCAEHSKEMSCKMHKDGKCSCKGKQCKCKDCKEHAQAMTCAKHKDGKCSCEGDKCECENCSEHA